MGVNVILDKAKIISVTVFLNRENAEGQYCPIAVGVQLEAYSDDGTRKTVPVIDFYGTPKAESYTIKEIFPLLPAHIQTTLKKAYLQAINEDISQ